MPDDDPSLPSNRQGLLFVLIVLAVCLAVFGAFWVQRLMQGQEIDDNKYNGFEFQPQGDDELQLWSTLIKAKGKTFWIPFYHHPRELEDIGMQAGITRLLLEEQYLPDMIYLTFDPDATSDVIIAGVEISRVTGYKYDLINIETHSALQAPIGNGTDYPIVTCADATPSTMVLSFEPGEYSDIYQDSEHLACLHFTYTNATDAIRVADRFVYGLLGIMDG